MTPNKIYAGDTLEFTKSVPEYLPSDGWTLKMRFAPRFTSPSQSPITLTADVSGSDYLLQAGISVTSTWVPGIYGWYTWVEKPGARVTLEGTQHQGELTVMPDPATLAQGADTRSAARKAYDDAIAARASYAASGNAGVAEYQIGDRRMRFKSPAELNEMINRLAVEVAREKRAEALGRGLPDPSRVYVRAARV